MFSAATGRNIDAAFLDETGERIWNMTRLFNLREGIDPKEDRLPRRFVEEPLPSGPQKGHRITEEDMDYLRRDYYRLRGWNENGHPTKETLSRLRLDGNESISI
jgi:aldehyde:ferredoxin oxidoreductase